MKNASRYLGFSASIVAVFLVLLICAAQAGSAVEAAPSEPTLAAGSPRDSLDAQAEKTVVQIVTAYMHNCARFSDGTVKCWGGNGFPFNPTVSGQLGLGDTVARGDNPGEMGLNLPDVDLGAGRTAIFLTTADKHTCAILDDSSLKCWGPNLSGALGQGDGEHRGNDANEMGDNLLPINLGAGRTVVQVDGGNDHTCALLDDGSLKCWGTNVNGELGLGNDNARGDNPGEMGDNLPAVDLGTGAAVSQISLGSQYSCARLESGNVKCWGRPGVVMSADVNDKVGDEPGEMGDNLSPIDFGVGRAAVHLSSGFQHACAILDNTELKCWGINTVGALGRPADLDKTPRAVDLGTGVYAVDVEAGYDSTCVLLNTGAVKCWGYNYDGQAGRGHNLDVGDDPGEMGDALLPMDLGTNRTAVELSNSFEHVCVRLDNGAIKCWGFNLYGTLGLGDTNSRGDTPGETGNALPEVDLGLELFPPGDVDRSGDTTVSDVLAIRALVAQGDDVPANHDYDVNGDLVVDAEDALALLRILAGLPLPN